MLKFIYDVNAFFVPIFRSNFYFDPYISILLLLIPNPINACYFSPFCHSTNRKNWHGKRSALLTVNVDVTNKIIITKLFIIE